MISSLFYAFYLGEIWIIFQWIPLASQETLAPPVLLASQGFSFTAHKMRFRYSGDCPIQGFVRSSSKYQSTRTLVSQGFQMAP